MEVIRVEVSNMIFILYQLEDLNVNMQLFKARELVEQELKKLENEC